MIEFIYKSTSLFSFVYNKEYIFLIFLSILSRTFFSRYFLRNKLYKHHFVSLTLFLVEYFFMCILTFCAGDLKFENWSYLLFIILRSILIGSKDVLNKNLFTNKFLLPHSLMFLIGLYNSGMVILLILILKILSFELIFPKN